MGNTTSVGRTVRECTASYNSGSHNDKVVLNRMIYLYLSIEVPCTLHNIRVFSMQYSLAANSQELLWSAIVGLIQVEKYRTYAVVGNISISGIIDVISRPSRFLLLVMLKLECD